jgi:pimeloyl-ACP methyl ester carboxylesterase
MKARRAMLHRKLDRMLRTGSAVVAVGLVIGCFSAVSAEPAIGTERPTPTHVSTFGVLRVEAYGSGSPAMVFVPGLACGSWVWDSAVREYAPTHAVYIVTLAGFDGLPAPAAPGIDGAEKSLLEVLTKLKLDRPVIVGHSLGGYIALRFGAEHPDLVRGIVAVDEPPVLPPFARDTPEERKREGNRFFDRVAGLTPEQFGAGQEKVIATMVSDPRKADQVAALAAKSDPATVAAYGRDLYAADLRPDLKKLTVPVLEIAPVPAKAADFEGPQALTQTPEQRAAMYRSYYASLFPGAPSVEVETVFDSLHFIMIDQPQALYAAISRFIGAFPQ